MEVVYPFPASHDHDRFRSISIALQDETIEVDLAEVARIVFGVYYGNDVTISCRNLAFRGAPTRKISLKDASHSSHTSSDDSGYFIYGKSARWRPISIQVARQDETIEVGFGEVKQVYFRERDVVTVRFKDKKELEGKIPTTYHGLVIRMVALDESHGAQPVSSSPTNIEVVLEDGDIGVAFTEIERIDFGDEGAVRVRLKDGRELKGKAPDTVRGQILGLTGFHEKGQFFISREHIKALWLNLKAETATTGPQEHARPNR